MLEYPYFLINYKIYDGTAGDDGLALTKTIEAIADRTGASFVVAPQTPDLSWIAEEISLPVVAQSANALDPGRGTGRISLPTVAAAGVSGVLVNHAENRQTLTDIEQTISRCEDYHLESLVCVDSVEIGRAALAFDSDCLVFEKPADIATDRSITRTHPQRVEAFVAMVADVNPRTRVLLGGGISTVTDVEQALELGADAAGAASAFVDATDRRAWLSNIAEVLLEERTG
ncbi:MAG: triose-phosphate isomerase [Natronomonas sp.]